MGIRSRDEGSEQSAKAIGPIQHHNLPCLTILLIADVIQTRFVVFAGYGIIVWNRRKSCPRRGAEMGSTLEQINGLTHQVQVWGSGRDQRCVTLPE